MKENKAVGFGVFIISAGIIWGLVSLGIISWNIINSLILLWPLILVLIGVSIIFRDNEILKGLAWFAFLAVIITHSFVVKDDASIVNKDGSTVVAGEKVLVEKEKGLESARLKLGFGAIGIHLDSETDQTLEAEIEDKYIKFYKNIANGVADFRFAKDSYKLKAYKLNNNYQKSNFHLSTGVPWEIDINTGASEADFDMRELKIEKLDLNTGASNMKFRFGKLSSNPKVDINAGVSQISIYVPSDCAVSVMMDGALNTKNLDGERWEKKGNYYYSRGYDGASVKIDIKVKMGVGSFNIYFE